MTETPDVPYTVILLDPITWHVDERPYPNAARAARAANRAVDRGQEVVACEPAGAAS